MKFNARRLLGYLKLVMAVMTMTIAGACNADKITGPDANGARASQETGVGSAGGNRGSTSGTQSAPTEFTVTDGKGTFVTGGG